MVGLLWADGATTVTAKALEDNVPEHFVNRLDVGEKANMAGDTQALELCCYKVTSLAREVLADLVCGHLTDK